ncbi:ATP-binding protein [Streptomyces sp. NPDC005435]|uniref:ATP-binding protein n=1 Tax=Streptomyces sp. NPDC005435 TaxID=3154464 RepID=UPI003456020A
MFSTDSGTASPGDARRLAVAHLERHCPGADIPAVQVVLSELVTNAARHTPEGTWTLTLRHADGMLTLQVEDFSPHLPRPRQGDTLDGHGGLGLGLVERLSNLVTTTRTATGKAVVAHWKVDRPTRETPPKPTQPNG